MNKYVLATIAFTFMIFTHIFATKLPLNGQTAVAILNKQQLLLTPSNYIFSIVGLIYFLLFIWLILQWKWKQASSKELLLFIMSCVLNSIWLICWHFEYFFIALLFMYSLLFCVLQLYQHYSIENFNFSGRFPFSFYLGWISFQTILYTIYTFEYLQLTIINDLFVTILLLAFTVVVALRGKLHFNDPYFSIVFIWSFLGIAEKTNVPAISFIAYSSAILVLIVIATATLIFHRKSELQQW